MSNLINKQGTVTPNAGSISTSDNQVEQGGVVLDVKRRTFIQTVTMGAAAFALAGCGGSASAGGGTQARTPMDSNPPPSNSLPSSTQAPEWSAVPTITFTQGVAASISIAAYVSDPNDDALAITKNSIALPQGVIYDAASKSFVYDGLGDVGITDGHILTAVEG